LAVANIACAARGKFRYADLRRDRFRQGGRRRYVERNL